MAVEMITKWGPHTIKTTGETIKDVLEPVGFLAEVPQSCPVPDCGCQVMLAVRWDPDGNKYFNARCTNAKGAHEASLGQAKDNKRLFYKPQWKDVYKHADEDRQEEGRARGANQPQGHRQPQQVRTGGGEFED